MTDSEPIRGTVDVAAPDASGLATPNSGEPELLVAATPDEVASLATERIVRALTAAAQERGRADFATTGGSTPIPIYRMLAATPLRDSLPWDRIHVWWSDDRYVPRDHPESNVTALDQVLLRSGAHSGASGQGASGTDVAAGMAAGAPLPAGNVHPFPTDLAITEHKGNDWCANRYAEEMAAQLPVDDGNWPVFDLMLVGVGDDGHVLSCFPNSPAFGRDEWAMGVPAPTHIGPHIERVTLNPRILDAAPVLVVTTGSSKAEALGHVFGDVRDDRRWPVQRTRRPGVVWIVDEAAAARIPRELRG